MRKRERRKRKLNKNHTESMSDIFKLTECYQAGTNIKLLLLWGRTEMGRVGYFYCGGGRKWVG